MTEEDMPTFMMNLTDLLAADSGKYLSKAIIAIYDNEIP
jgi:hypothetical protein